MITKEEKEKILIWAGKPTTSMYIELMGCLDFLNDIVEDKLFFKANYYMELKAGHGRYSIMVAPNFKPEVAVYSGIHKSLVEALQQALLKLANEK